MRLVFFIGVFLLHNVCRCAAHRAPLPSVYEPGQWLRRHLTGARYDVQRTRSQLPPFPQ
ncbi:hypothetical protein HMPREF0742_00926 [Rothia aeria F0184]|uniref:Uncharacterized protein n=1 Tax=Rothia aeria F0184 TaxID=888019 RepID=U7V4Q4_9MICC|nr:hypothetical protein HMPREF0742_00926 [Rothia aeria F0184]